MKLAKIFSRIYSIQLRSKYVLVCSTENIKIMEAWGAVSLRVQYFHILMKDVQTTRHLYFVIQLPLVL